MPKLAEQLSEADREALKELAIRTGTVCECGRNKSRKHLHCVTCAKRYPGPYVIVESPSGRYIEKMGIESPLHFKERNYGLTDSI